MSDVDRAREERRLQDLASERKLQERKSQEQGASRERAARFVPSQSPAHMPTELDRRRQQAIPARAPLPKNAATERPSQQPPSQRGPDPARPHDVANAAAPAKEQQLAKEQGCNDTNARLGDAGVDPSTLAQVIGHESSPARRKRLPDEERLRDEELPSDAARNTDGDSSLLDELALTPRAPATASPSPNAEATASRAATLSAQFEQISQLARLCEWQRGSYAFDFTLQHPSWPEPLQLAFTSLGRRRVRMSRKDGSPWPPELDLAPLRRELARRDLRLLDE